ncbi:MAG: DUF6644 family protein [Vicinamibacterales bacterium]
MLEPFFQWMESVGVYSASPLIGPIVNLIHLLCMVTFIGALLIVDLRLMGAGLTGRPVREIARDAQPWLVGGFLGLVLTGIPALMSTATLQYPNRIFWFKMYLLAAACIFTMTVRRGMTQTDEVQGALPKLVGLLSIVAWLGVAASARLIMLL